MIVEKRVNSCSNDLYLEDGRDFYSFYYRNEESHHFRQRLLNLHQSMAGLSSIILESLFGEIPKVRNKRENSYFLYCYITDYDRVV